MGVNKQSRSDLPVTIRRLLDYAKNLLDPEKIILFGSRARGDARETSDFDLAFVIATEREKDWPRFVCHVQEEPFTLHKLDLVNWSEASESLREKILQEGITLYE